MSGHSAMKLAVDLRVALGRDNGGELSDGGQHECADHDHAGAASEKSSCRRWRTRVSLPRRWPCTQMRERPLSELLAELVPPHTCRGDPPLPARQDAALLDVANLGSDGPFEVSPGADGLLAQVVGEHPVPLKAWSIAVALRRGYTAPSGWRSEGAEDDGRRGPDGRSPL